MVYRLQWLESINTLKGAFKVDSTLKVGDKVMWRGGWGRYAAQPARIQSMELLSKGSSDDGVGINEVLWSMVENYVVVTLDNGKWAYGYQISKIEE